jgi:2-methylcitrate dehydratase PrpD
MIMADGSIAAVQENATAEPVARKLANFTHSFQYDDIPSSVRARAKFLILDAVGIAGRQFGNRLQCKTAVARFGSHEWCADPWP